jgi:SAM-dependent methyltransferase
MNEKKIINYYNRLLSKYGFNQKGLGWGESDLTARYKIFDKHIEFKNKSVFDFGAGTGELCKFLKKKKIKKYLFYDINPNLVKFIKSKYRNKATFIKKKNIKSVDVVISNGTHSSMINNNYNNFFKDINFFYKITKKAFGISFITDNVDFKEKKIHYKSLSKIIKYMQTKNYKFIIDLSFKKYEAFLIIYK